MARSTGMGRGLNAILALSPPGEEQDELREIPVELIRPNPSQPRRSFDEAGLEALAGSLGERGVLQPILVRPLSGGTFELVAGERRWRAAQLAGLDRLPALVRQRDDAETIEVALVENMAREDLNPIEEARAVAALVEELGLTREAVGKRVGRSRVAVSNLLRLLDLPDEALALVEAGALSEGHGKALLLAEANDVRRRLAHRAVGEGWSVRVLEARAREHAAGGTTDRVDGTTPGRTRGSVHPDQAAAMDDIADRLGAALGRDVKVRPRGTGYRVELLLDSPDEVEELLARARAAG